MMVYEHLNYIETKIKEKKGSPLGEAYINLRDTKYYPMRKAILEQKYDAESVDSFEKSADILNGYWLELRRFMKTHGIGDNTKLHTNFLEEFSVYFFDALISKKQFDVYNKDIFAGLRIDSSNNITQETKNVDFCIGKAIESPFGNKPKELIVPLISIEVKSYIEKTMLREIMYTANKLKGANPQSKAFVLTWSNGLSEEALLEAVASDLDEIIVLSPEKRNTKTKNEYVVFTKEGLCDYYKAFKQAIEQVTLIREQKKTLGRVLWYSRNL